MFLRNKFNSKIEPKSSAIPADLSHSQKLNRKQVLAPKKQDSKDSSSGSIKYSALSSSGPILTTKINKAALRKNKDNSVEKKKKGKVKKNKSTPQLNDLLARAEGEKSKNEDNFEILMQILLNKKLREELKNPDNLEKFYTLYSYSIDLFVLRLFISNDRSLLANISDDDLLELTEESTFETEAYIQSDFLKDIDRSQAKLINYMLRHILKYDSRESRLLVMERYAMVLQKLFALGDLHSVRAINLMFHSTTMKNLGEFDDLSEFAKRIISQSDEFFSNKTSQRRLLDLSIGSSIPDIGYVRGLIMKASSCGEEAGREFIIDVLNSMKHLLAQNSALSEKTGIPFDISTIVNQDDEKIRLEKLAKEYKINASNKKGRKQAKRQAKTLKEVQDCLEISNGNYMENDGAIIIQNKYIAILEKLEKYSHSEEKSKLQSELGIFERNLVRIPEVQANLAELENAKTPLKEYERERMADYKRELSNLLANQEKYKAEINIKQAQLEALNDNPEYQSKKRIGDLLHHLSKTSSITERINLIDMEISSSNHEESCLDMLQQFKFILNSKRKIQFDDNKITESKYVRRHSWFGKPSDNQDMEDEVYEEKELNSHTTHDDESKFPGAPTDLSNSTFDADLTERTISAFNLRDDEIEPKEPKEHTKLQRSMRQSGLVNLSAFFQVKRDKVTEEVITPTLESKEDKMSPSGYNSN